MIKGLEAIALLLVTEFDWLFLHVPGDLGRLCFLTSGPPDLHWSASRH